MGNKEQEAALTSDNPAEGVPISLRREMSVEVELQRPPLGLLCIFGISLSDSAVQENPTW